MCTKGSECTCYHRIPLPSDDCHIDTGVDCFGRQRHSSYRGDMSGVGSFLNPSRTLFVGNLITFKYNSEEIKEITETKKRENVLQSLRIKGKNEKVKIIEKIKSAEKGLNGSLNMSLNGAQGLKGSLHGLEGALWRHFSEWGEVEDINVVQRLFIAFPRYRLRISAGAYVYDAYI